MSVQYTSYRIWYYRDQCEAFCCLLVSTDIFNHVNSRFFPAYWDCVYFTLMPSGWRFKKLCKLVHNFSMEVIKKRRAELNERKVLRQNLKIVLPHIFILCVRREEKTFSQCQTVKEESISTLLISY